MAKFEIQFSYRIPEWGDVTLDAVDAAEAEELALEYVKDTYTDITDITVDNIKELIDAN